HGSAKLRHLHQAKEDAFRNGDRVLYNQARNTLNKEIRVAKRSYAKKLEHQFSSNDPASVWKGLKDITNYKTPSPSTEANQQLTEDLNEFYCRFETAAAPPALAPPQGCVLSRLLFSLYTNDCISTDPSVKLLKFADDTTVIGLIQDGDESAYRQEVEQLAVWCSLNNLELNTLRTVEMIVDFRRNTPALPPLTIMNSTVPDSESDFTFIIEEETSALCFCAREGSVIFHSFTHFIKHLLV
ncbi:hypothetical protein QTP86_026475, partial [Hemibagrus guttatus]